VITDFTAFGFSEASSTLANQYLDFTRCVRPDGTAYGTRGKCRKGTEQAKPQKESKPRVKKSPKEAYALLVKKQQEMVDAGDMEGALKLKDAIAKRLKEVEASPEGQEQQKTLKKAAKEITEKKESFEEAQERRNRDQTEAKLNDTDKKALLDYTEEGVGMGARSYTSLNKCLRAPANCSEKEESEKFMKELDSAIAKLPKNEKGDEFYRGISVGTNASWDLYDSLSEAQPGTKLKDPGFGSFSAEKKRAEDFANMSDVSIMFVTRNKSMTPINMYSAISSENEALLPRGTELTVRKVTKDGENLIVELD